MHLQIKKEIIDVKHIQEGMRKLTDNFYLLIRKSKWWTPKQIKTINKYLNYKLFLPIPKSFVEQAIFGYNGEPFNFYEKEPPKYIMFNFDIKNKKRLSLRGMCTVSINGKNKETKYFTIELIGNKSVTIDSVKAVKLRHSIKTKNGKDMIEWWKRFGKHSCFKYCKLNAMDDVIGFYWKCGWRFGENFDYFKKKEERIHNHIKKLNHLNFKIKKLQTKSVTELDYIKDAILQKYFDKYIEGYYCDTKLKQYSLYDEDFKNYNIKSTSHLVRFNMRYHGYPMYLDCS